mgnify:CR=1 FL=1
MSARHRQRRKSLFQGVDVDTPLLLECDVAVVGSGAGGGAAAYELAAAGLDVLVLEEGAYRHTGHFSADVGESIRGLYRNSGTNIIFGTPEIMFTEGRTVGGSTVINGGICWRTPPKILKRWVWEHQLPARDFSPDALEPIFERVEDMIHAAPQNPESVGRDSILLKEGCDALGYRTSPVYRSQKDCMGSNNCIFGCPTGAKQSTLVTYLPGATRRGARIQSDARVTRLNFDQHGRVTGLRGRIYNPEVGRQFPLSVRARSVVLSCGATQTPVLLKASRAGNRWVGRNLMVHPNAKVCGLYDQTVQGWQGTIQGYQVEEFREEGLLMAPTFIPPGLLAAGLPHIGDDLGALMSQLNHIVTAGVLVEDSTTGRVRRGPGGQALMTYRCTHRDMLMFQRGLAFLSEILFASGARRVLLPVIGMDELTTPDDISKIFSRPLPPERLELFTVHVMGTARLAANAERGVCDPGGRVFGHSGLYIADASLLPGAIGVNPQITVMALATHVAWNVVGDLLQHGIGR